ncbi:hypothetical protein [Methylopila turkensis]|nr:hypothetical protein [Methylopila turkensis]
MRALQFVCAFVAVVAAGSAASAADYARYESRQTVFRGYTGALPACGDERVLGHIAGRFASRERGYWGSSLELAGFSRTRELGYRSWGAEFIPRRFCAARVVTTDGRKRSVYYEIGEGFAFAGAGWDVNWCVTGLDRNLAYAPGCKMARP